jgi:aspartyl-tRNA(Asn)/glutamyl-tRNA(Gln) amidotransferase subunit A
MLSRRAFVGSMLAAPVPAAEEAVVWRSIEATADALRRRRVSAVELTKLCLERIDRLNGRFNAFVTLTAEAALEQAKSLDADARRGAWRGPLHGIPIGLKDLYDTAGVRTTAASKHWADRVPTADAEAVRRLKAAGAVVLGKLNMDEFAYNFTGETSSFGTSRNPWNPDLSPGGSSGGSAVAVATGMCYGALGSDTGGSIRLPAAFCGITGLKPTYGAVSTDGAAPLAWSLDHVGPMCRTARDAAVMLGALTGTPLRLAGVNVKALRVGVPRAVFYDDLDPEMAAAVASATKTLGGLTAGARDVVLPVLPTATDAPIFPETYLRIIAAEAYAFHRDMLRMHADRYHAGTRRSIEMGAPVTAADYIHAKRELERLRADSRRWFADADVLVTPTAPGPAFAFGKGRLVFLRNTAPWNLLGLPTISIPCGFTRAGLPIGVQITGAMGRDDAVLAAAAAYQQATDWHLRHPVP